MAKAIGTSPAFLWQIKTGRKKVPTDLCAQIEIFTKGAITRKQLRPDNWHKIWPELMNQTDDLYSSASDDQSGSTCDEQEG